MAGLLVSATVGSKIATVFFIELPFAFGVALRFLGKRPIDGVWSDEVVELPFIDICPFVHEFSLIEVMPLI